MRHLLLIVTLAFSLLASARDIDSGIELANGYVDSRPDSAVLLADDLLAREGKRMTPTQRAAALVVKSNGHFSSGELPEALNAINEAVKVSRQACDTSMLVQALSDAGVMNRVAQNPDAALKCYKEALALVRRAGDADDEAHLLVSIGILFTNSGRASDAVPYARDAVRKAAEGATPQTRMYVGSQAGLILFKAGHKEEGLKIERQIVGIARKENLPRYILKTYTAILSMHKEMGRRDSVNYYIARGEELMKSVPEASVESVGFLEQVFEVLSDMGRYRESLDVQRRILAMKDAPMYIPLDKLWQSVGANYARLGDAKKSSEAYERSIAIADSLRNTEIDAQLSEFDARYGVMKKQMEITRLQEEKSRMRMWIVIWVAVGVLLLGAAAIWIVLRRRREAAERIRENLRGIEQERARLACELHDGVCNDLYGVGLLLATGACDTSEVRQEIGRIGGEVRHISHELMPPSLAGADLAELLGDMAARSGGFIVFRQSPETGATVRGETGFQLYRIVQELTANIRKHTDAEKVGLSLFDEGATLELKLEYEGTPKSATSDAAGIGTKTIQRRLELIGATMEEREDRKNHVVTISANGVK